MVLLSGCEWTGGGGVDYWDSSGDWVDFSGSYKAADGRYLVTRFGTGLDTVTSTNIVFSEHIGTADGNSTVFGGNLAHPPIAGSVNIEVGAVGGYVFWDETGGSGTANLQVSPADGSSGTVNYDTGAWSLSFPAPLARGVMMMASYIYRHTSTVSEQGNTGEPIYSFVLYQTGNRIQLIDSNGATYEGQMGSVRTSGGRPPEPGATPTSGPVEAQFSAYGVSQGYNVTIVGVLQGQLQGAALMNRTMRATYIEEGGREADISAVAP